MISFFVAGRPAQRGSKRAMPNPKGGRPLMVDDNVRSKPWMAAVAAAGADAMNGRKLLEGPLRIEVSFCFSRPKSHFHQRKSGQVLRGDAPHFHSSKPDADKSLRAIGDALTGVVYRDDAQLADVRITKVYIDGSEGALIEVSPATNDREL